MTVMMAWRLRFSVIGVLPAAALIWTGIATASGAPTTFGAATASSAGAQTRHAQALVKRELRAMNTTAVRVRCDQLRDARSGKLRSRWRCAWTGLRQPGDRSCHGTYNVAIHRHRWRVSAAGASCALPATDYGFNDNSVGLGLVSPSTDAALNSQAGASVVRTTFDWQQVEWNRGQYHFEFYDRMDAAMRARGIRPLFVLLFAPRWAWSGALLCLNANDGCLYPPAPGHVAEAAQMAAMIATRYPDAAGIEIWNEPNISEFWRPRPDPAAYTKLLVASYQAVKRANASMPVVIGGLANQQLTVGSEWSMSDFLHAVYAQGGGGSTDALAFHPYPSLTDPSLMVRSFDQVRGVRHQFGDDAKPLWATELGVTTSDSKNPITEIEQATRLAGAFRAVTAMPDVRMLIFNTLIESGSPLSYTFGFGVLKPDLSPRPAFCALAALRRSSFSCSA